MCYKRRLNSISPYTSEKVYETYSFGKRTVRITKRVVVDYYVVDRKRNQIDKYSREYADATKSFTLLTGLSPKDRRYARHKSSANEENDVQRHEQSSFSIQLDEVFSTTRLSAEKLGSVSDIENQIFGRETKQDAGYGTTVSTGSQPRTISTWFSGLVSGSACGSSMPRR